MSRMLGTRPRTASSHPFLPRHAPSIFPLSWTRIYLGFRPPELFSVATSSFNFLFFAKQLLLHCQRFLLQHVQAEANTPWDMALTPGPTASSKASAAAATQVPMTSTMVPTATEATEAASMVNLDTSRQVQCLYPMAMCLERQSQVQTPLLVQGCNHSSTRSVQNLPLLGPAAPDEPCPVFTSSSSESEMLTL
jgi:hypothetical protein